MDAYEVDCDKINDEQKAFYQELVAWRPDFETYCKIETLDGKHYNLRVEVPSPTGDEYRKIVVWSDAAEISVGFGPWHTHGGARFDTETQHHYEEFSIIDVVKMIVSNVIVVSFETTDGEAFSEIINLKYENAIASVLTDPYSTGEIDVRSWDGTQDRKASLKDLIL